MEVAFTMTRLLLLSLLLLVVVASSSDAGSLRKKNLNEPDEELKHLTERFSLPRELRLQQNSTQLEPHQFIHLHHMKTGGTSMDTYLRCATGRLRKDRGYTIDYQSIHECSSGRYTKCRNGDSPSCWNQIAEASMMSYCAPLKDLPAFDWKEPPTHGAITELRHPVDRVWSMFRFQTKYCYKCTPLLDIYKKIDAGDAAFDKLCLKQLQNHEVANLLSTEWPEDATDEELVQEAIDNMKSFFTMIGLTEQLNETISMAGTVFDWMKPAVDWSSTQCHLSHANASPSNNRCGPKNTHWDLPSHPDKETRKAIEEHNQLDMQLYEAAVQHFELQKEAAGLDEEAT